MPRLVQLSRGLLVVAFSVLFIVGWQNDAIGGGMSFGEAVNKAGRQRMLTQRIVLTYCQVGLGVTAEVSTRRLHAAVRLFDAQLAELKDGVDDKTVRKAIGQVEAIWKPFKKIALGPINRNSAEELLFWHDDLLHASHKVVQLLQDRSGRAVAHLVNISGRQRMLSQRLAKYYMLKEWRFDGMTISQEMTAAHREFGLTLEKLRAANQNTPAINKELDDIALQWTWFEMALTLQKDQTYRLVVADSSETILIAMDRIVEMYERLSMR